MPKETDNSGHIDDLITAWRTSHNVTTHLIRNLPLELWPEKVPGSSRWTIRHIAAHIHNARCGWIKRMGACHGIETPKKIDMPKAMPEKLLIGLEASSERMIEVFRLGAANGGPFPGASWQNFPNDLTHFLCYFVAHEAHHRGQIVLTARALGHPLKENVMHGLWRWKKRAQE